MTTERSTRRWIICWFHIDQISCPYPATKESAFNFYPAFAGFSGRLTARSINVRPANLPLFWDAKCFDGKGFSSFSAGAGSHRFQFEPLLLAWSPNSIAHEETYYGFHFSSYGV